jgi:hypothetical protein
MNRIKVTRDFGIWFVGKRGTKDGRSRSVSKSVALNLPEV